MAMVNRLSLAPAAILSLAVAQAVSAATIVAGNASGAGGYALSNTPAATNMTATFPSLPTMTFNAQGNFTLFELDNVSTDPNFSYSHVYFYSAAGATPVSVGPTDAVYSMISSQGPTLYQTTLKALGANGSVLGIANRSGGIAYNFQNPSVLGTDVFLYSGGSNTVINSLGAIAATNTSGTYDGNAYYAFTKNFNADGTANASGALSDQFRSSTAAAVNSANQVIGSSKRYTGVANDSLTLGQDAWVYTPGAATPVAIIGFADVTHTNNSSVDNGVTYYSRTNTPIALNSSGSVIGTAIDYGGGYTDSNGVTGTTPIYANESAGTDSWLYKGGTSTQIGITGITISVNGSGNNVYTNQTAALGGFYSVVTTDSLYNVTYAAQTSTVSAINDSGAIAGVTTVYATGTNFSHSTKSLGQEAWIYTPTSAPGMGVATSSGGPYGTTSAGTYTQVGLLTTGTTTVYGYIGSAAGITGYRSSAIFGLDSSGNAAGTSSRFLSNSSAANGADAWYYKAGVGTTNITPVATPASNAITYSNYISSGKLSTSAVTAITNAGLAGGTQNRYMSTSTAGLGQDAWVYDSSNSNTYVIASPAIIALNPVFSSVAGDASNTEFFAATLSGVTNAGLAYGYFNAYVGSTTSSGLIGSYAYLWTEATGTMILTGMSSSNTVGALSSTGWGTLLSNPSTLVGSLYVDAAGNLYGVGTEANGSYGVYEITAPLSSGNGTWHNGSGDGVWTTSSSSGSNWTAGVPNGVGQIATFDDTVSGTPGTVDLNGNKTVGGIVLNTASTGYTLGLAATSNILTFQNSSADATIGVSGGATHTINALVNLAGTTDVTIAAGATLNLAGAVSGAGNLTLTGGGVLKLSAAAGNTFAGTTVNGGTLLVANTSGSATGSANVTLNGGTLGGSGAIAGAVVAGTGPHTIAPSTTLAPNSTTTLTMGGLTTNAATTLSFNLVSPGASDQIAITGASALTINGGTLAINNSAANVGLPSLGYSKIIAYSGSILGAGVTSIALPPMSAGLITYTLDTAHNAGFVDVHRGFSGDANDDGLVNFADFVLLSNNFGLSGTGWAGGDFNGDGIMNFADFVLLSNNFGQTVGGSSELSAAQIASFHEETASFAAPSSVPEPGSLALIGLGAAALLNRRRKT